MRNWIKLAESLYDGESYDIEVTSFSGYAYKESFDETTGDPWVQELFPVFNINEPSVYDAKFKVRFVNCLKLGPLTRFSDLMEILKIPDPDYVYHALTAEGWMRNRPDRGNPRAPVVFYEVFKKYLHAKAYGRLFEYARRQDFDGIVVETGRDNFVVALSKGTVTRVDGQEDSQPKMGDLFESREPTPFECIGYQMTRDLGRLDPWEQEVNPSFFVNREPVHGNSMNVAKFRLRFRNCLKVTKSIPFRELEALGIREKDVEDLPLFYWDLDDPNHVGRSVSEADPIRNRALTGDAFLVEESVQEALKRANFDGIYISASGYSQTAIALSNGTVEWIETKPWGSKPVADPEPAPGALFEHDYDDAVYDGTGWRGETSETPRNPFDHDDGLCAWFNASVKDLISYSRGLVSKWEIRATNPLMLNSRESMSGKEIIHRFNLKSLDDLIAAAEGTETFYCTEKDDYLEVGDNYDPAKVTTYVADLMDVKKVYDVIARLGFDAVVYCTSGEVDNILVFDKTRIMFQGMYRAIDSTGVVPLDQPKLPIGGGALFEAKFDPAIFNNPVRMFGEGPEPQHIFVADEAAARTWSEECRCSMIEVEVRLSRPFIVPGKGGKLTIGGLRRLGMGEHVVIELLGDQQIDWHTEDGNVYHITNEPDDDTEAVYVPIDYVVGQTILKDFFVRLGYDGIVYQDADTTCAWVLDPTRVRKVGDFITK